jgi:general stress protein 26
MEDNDRANLRALVEEFRTGMLVTRVADSTMRARPMTVAKFEANDDLFFAAGIDSGTVAEIEADPEIVVTFQSSSAYISLSGPARVVSSRSVIERYWSEPMRVWFPEGPTAHSLCFIQLRPVQGEFWSTQGTKGLRYAFDAAKAYVTGTTPRAIPGQHGEVGVPHAR